MELISFGKIFSVLVLVTVFDLSESWPSWPSWPSWLFWNTPIHEEVRYLLWTRENADNNAFYHINHRSRRNLLRSPFKAERPTYFIVHGFESDGLSDWVLEAKKDILSQYDANIISVDWEELCPAPWYLSAVNNLYKVGEHTADFIDWLNEETGLPPEKVEIAGHSLGAHVAGITGQSLKSGTLARITGMDPSGPLFYDKTNDRHLNAADAKFVDIIHTNGGDWHYGDLGLDERIGDVDFYVNGGSSQAGCDHNIEFIGDVKDVVTSCSHSRAHEYWRESIRAGRRGKTFTSWPCKSEKAFENKECAYCGQGCLDMGFHVNRGLKGTYYLRTNSYSPFAKGNRQ